VSRATRIAIYMAAGFAAGLALVALAVLILTRTEAGRARVRDFAVQRIQNEIKGNLKVGRIGPGGWLGGMTLENVEITDPRNRPFLQVDRIRLRYNLRTLLAGQIKLHNIDLYNPRVVLEELPGDSVWNYEYIFPDTTVGDTPNNRLVELTNVRIHNGLVTIRQALSEDRNEATDTVRNIIETADHCLGVVCTPGTGQVRVLRFDSVNAHLNRVLWESPDEEGRLFEARRVAAVAYLWKEPVRIRNLRGKVVTRDTVMRRTAKGTNETEPLISFQFEPIEFGGSKADMFGYVIQDEGRNIVNVQIDGRKLAFKDLQWLYPKLPSEGSAELKLRIQSQRKGTLWYASNARIEAPDTRVSGSFGIVTGDTMYFTDVDLRASPLNMELLERILPGKLPVQGLMVGTVEVKGPISALDTKGDIRITPTNSSTTSSVRWEGVLDGRAQFAMTRLQADVGGLDLALINALRPGLDLPKGLVRGRVEADGSVNNQIRFSGQLQHELAGRVSRFEGNGTYDAPTRQLDLKLNALPLSFEELAHAYPGLEKLRGEARGPINFSGPIDNLKVQARLATAAGELDFKGALQRSEGRRRYSGEGVLSNFQLERLVNGVPAANVSGNVQFDLSGKSVADATGRVAAQLQQAHVSGVALRNVSLDSRMNDGVLAIDSLRATSVLGQVNASGEFGIAQGKTGTVNYTVRTDSIVPLNGDGGATTGGQLNARGTVSGGVYGFDLSAEATVQRALYSHISAARSRLRVQGRALTTDTATLQVTLAADTAKLYGERLDSVRGSLTYNAGGGRLSLFGGTAERGYRLTGDVFLDSTDVRLAVQQAAGGLHDQLWVLQSPFNVRFGATGLAADSFALRQVNGRGYASVVGRLAWARSRADSLATAGQPLDFRLTLRNAPLNDYWRFVRTNEATDGFVDTEIAISGTAAAPIINANATFTDLRYGDTRFDRLTGSFAYAGQRINARVLGQHEGRELISGHGNIPLDLSFVPVATRKLSQPLEFTLNADSLPASVVLSLVNGFREVGGTVSGNIDLRGTTREPTIAGLLTLSNGTAIYNATNIRYRNVGGTFRVLNDSVVAIDAVAFAGTAGRAELKGNMVFAPLGNPSFEDLIIDATAFPGANRRDAVLTTTGQLILGGEFRRPTLRGNIRIDASTLYLDEIYRQTQIFSPDPSNPLFFAVVDTSLVSVKRVLPSGSPFVRNLTVDNLIVDVGRDAWLRSRNLNVAVTGKLRVTVDRPDVNQARSVQDIRLDGELSAVSGTYRMEYAPTLGVPLVASVFQIREGAVDFPGTPGLDPNLAFTAAYRARPLTQNEDPFDILATVRGSLLAPSVRLSSDRSQPLAESDLASYLFFGVPTGALPIAESRTLTRTDIAGEVFRSYGTSLLYGAVTGELQKVFAQTYNWLDYISLTAADDVKRSASEETSLGQDVSSIFTNTKLELGRYIGRDVFLVVSALPGYGEVSPGQQFGVRVQWRPFSTYTFEAYTDNQFYRATSGIEPTRPFQRVYGLSLFWDWGY
jgi:translocation-and-assembly-module (TAM) inner membrane subunit TamB-like protein